MTDNKQKEGSIVNSHKANYPFIMFKTFVKDYDKSKKIKTIDSMNYYPITIYSEIKKENNKKKASDLDKIQFKHNSEKALGNLFLTNKGFNTSIVDINYILSSYELNRIVFPLILGSSMLLYRRLRVVKEYSRFKSFCISYLLVNNILFTGYNFTTTVSNQAVYKNFILDNLCEGSQEKFKLINDTGFDYIYIA